MLKLQDRPVAARYARALFAAASAHGEVEAVRRDLARLGQTLAVAPALNDALRHPRVPMEAKREVLSRVLGRFSPLLERFVGLLLEKKRWDALAEILPDFERLADDAGGILAVQAATPAPWTEEGAAKVRRALESAWGGPVSLKTSVREDLLGGIVLQVGDRVWDNSLKAQLERLREAWLAGAVR
ncbi:MAG: ATP synthase F1 subunit delta [Elusimicrobia bacterium]|nr:ATP synthase F1 subunit delta [Elusimicrobiota bacterium]